MPADPHHALVDGIDEMSVLAFGEDRQTATTVLQNRGDLAQAVLFLRREQVFDLRWTVRDPVESPCTDFRGGPHWPLLLHGVHRQIQYPRHAVLRQKK